MATESFPLPIVEMVAGATRRDLIDWALDHVENGDDSDTESSVTAGPSSTQPAEAGDEYYTQRAIAEDIERSAESLRQHLEPMVAFGVLDVSSEDAHFKRYTPSESPVLDALATWDGPSLTDLLATTARQKLLTFFLDQSDSDEFYSMAAIDRESPVSYQGVRNNIDVFVDIGLLETEETGRGTQYSLDTDSDLAAFCYELNQLLADVYHERTN
jgi:hypothetical protein